jgi:hypothetical protein
MRAVVCRLCVVIALAFAVACTGPSTSAVDELEIELDAFSGRPNPKWVLSGERAASISRGLAAPTGAPAATRLEPEHLGYRGFIIRQRGLHARVYDDHVTVTANGASRTFVDSADLEAQLIADARKRGFGDIVSTQR